MTTETKKELCKWQLEQLEFYKEDYQPFAVDLDTPSSVSAYNYDEKQDGIYITQFTCDGCEDAHDTHEIYLSKDEYLRLITMTVSIKTLFELIGEKFESKDANIKSQFADLERSDS